MKLAPIKREHLYLAAEKMDHEPSMSWSEYWVRLQDGREYQFKQIVRLAYEYAARKPIGDNFQSNELYRAYIEEECLCQVLFKVPPTIGFFTRENIDFFAVHASKEYRTGDAGLQQIGDSIKTDIFEKTYTWARSLNLKEWEIRRDPYWQMSGFFKSYSWVRLFKKGDENKGIFFTLGVDGINKSLVFRLDCLRKGNSKLNLTQEQIRVFDAIRGDSFAKDTRIPIGDLSNYNWEKLQLETIDFIARYEQMYEEALISVWSTASLAPAVELISGSLVEVPVPKSTITSLSKRKRNFTGYENDYDSENRRKKIIGDAGELLVINEERKRLIREGFPDLANKVEKRLDGEGYDILSFSAPKVHKYIEVKTTTGSALRPFVMSANEWDFMKEKSAQYQLYRVFNFNPDNKSGRFFCLKGDMQDFVLTREMQIEVFLKDTD